MKIKLESSAFGQGELIPLKHTGDDKDVSPPLRWSWAPKECKSIALIFEDPDAPISTWVHWVIFNIPADANSLPEGVPTDKILAGMDTEGHVRQKDQNIDISLRYMPWMQCLIWTRVQPKATY